MKTAIAIIAVLLLVYGAIHVSDRRALAAAIHVGATVPHCPVGNHFEPCHNIRGLSYNI